MGVVSAILRGSAAACILLALPGAVMAQTSGCALQNGDGGRRILRCPGGVTVTAEAGASFTMRLNELRLRKAAELLARRGERRIADIAFACGFNDLSYFNRCFRRRFGLTPSAARGP